MWYRRLYVQVVIAVAIDALLGTLAPAFAVEWKPLSDAFIRLIRMVLPP